MAGDARRRQRSRARQRGQARQHGQASERGQARQPGQASQHNQSRKRSGWRAGVVLVGAFALVVTGVVVALHNLSSAPPLAQRCVATLGTDRYTLDPDQADHAALFAAIAAERNLPPRAVTVAIATGMQESRLRNIAHGDRDSLGLFQQRPSQGWGTEEQVMDPVYATNAFYAGLEQVADWEAMEITVAAQAVQRSGFPDAYAQHEGMARAFAVALTGQDQASLNCTLAPAFDDDNGDNGDDQAEPPDPDRQTAMVAEALSERLDRELPWVSITEPDNQDAADSQDGAASEDGAGNQDAADSQDGADTKHAAVAGYMALRPATDAGTGADTDAAAGADVRQAAWSLAHWAVATAHATGASEVLTDGMRWERAGGEWHEAGPDEPPAATGEVLIR